MPSVFLDAFFWAAVAVCAVAQAAILRSALAAHRDVITAAPGSTLPPLRRAVEVAWTVLPALGLAVLLVFTWRAMHPATAAPAAVAPAMRTVNGGGATPSSPRLA